MRLYIRELIDLGTAVNSNGLEPLLKEVITRPEWAGQVEGDFTCSRPWIRKFCRKGGLAYRAGTSAAQKLPDQWEAVVQLWLHQIAYLTLMRRIPPQLVVNADQTGVHLVPMGRRTYARMGSKAIRLLGLDDKRQLTVVMAAAADGSMLPFQAIFAGGTDRSLPPLADRKPLSDEHGCGFAVTDNHWANLQTTKTWFDTIFLPYCEKAKATLGLPSEQQAMLIVDCWEIHMMQEFRDHVKAKAPWVILKYVPANCTSVAQPCDFGQQKPFKDCLRSIFAVYIVEAQRRMLQRGVGVDQLRCDLRLKVLKPLVPGFLGGAWMRLRDDPALVKLAWDKAGITACFGDACRSQALQLKEAQQLFPSVAEANESEAEGHDAPDARHGHDDDDDDDIALQQLHDSMEELLAAPPAIADEAGPSQASLNRN